MWQNLIVWMIVLVASVYAAWRLMPTGWRNRLAAGAAASGKQTGLLNAAQAAQLQQRLAKTASCGGGSGCSSCKGCSAAGKPAQEPDLP